MDADLGPEAGRGVSCHHFPHKSAPCVAGRGLAFVEDRSAMRSKPSIQAIGLIGQIEKIEHVGIRKIPGRSEGRHC
jgi:hypothetical protein